MQETSLNRAKALKPIVIAVRGEPQGVVVPQDGGYRFLAVRLPAFAIDGQHFSSIAAAQIAVSDAMKRDGEAA